MKLCAETEKEENAGDRGQGSRVREQGTGVKEQGTGGREQGAGGQGSRVRKRRTKKRDSPSENSCGKSAPGTRNPVLLSTQHSGPRTFSGTRNYSAPSTQNLLRNPEPGTPKAIKASEEAFMHVIQVGKSCSISAPVQTVLLCGLHCPGSSGRPASRNIARG